MIGNLPERTHEMNSRTRRRYGRLVVQRKDQKRLCRHDRCVCRCDCGGTISVRLADLRNGHTRSCGCLSREQLIQRSTTHGFYAGRKPTDTRFRFAKSISEQARRDGVKVDWAKWIPIFEERFSVHREIVRQIAQYRALLQGIALILGQ